MIRYTFIPLSALVCKLFLPVIDYNMLSFVKFLLSFLSQQQKKHYGIYCRIYFFKNFLYFLYICSNKEATDTTLISMKSLVVYEHFTIINLHHYFKLWDMRRKILIFW